VDYLVDKKEAFFGKNLFLLTDFCGSRIIPVCVEGYKDMQVTINGESRDFPGEMTVLELLVSLGLTDRRVAVEINRELVTRSLHATRKINSGDAIEIVSLVGGG